VKKIVMIRYGELFLKSEPVKRHFIGLLTRNITRALDSEGLSHRFELHRGRLLIHGDEPEEISAVVSRIFGVVDVSVGILTSNRPEEMIQAAVDSINGHVHQGMGFAVRARRQGVEGFSSQELAGMIGAAVLSRHPGLHVDLKEPEFEIFVEAREFGGIIYDRRIEAPGGLPWGTQGRVISLLSSGIDSPVASWLMMRRGCEVLHMHMEGGRWAGCDVRDTAFENHRKLSEWCRGFPLQLLRVDTEPFYDAMVAAVPPRLRCILCKRFMIQTASRLLERNDALAVVTGENLGQVASQTLANLGVISSVTTAPVLRPLITYDKDEIIALARKIGTFNQCPGDLSCKAVPHMPSTSAGLPEVLSAEEEISASQLVDFAVDSVRFLTAINGTIIIEQ
jgi:thiamine biosynthesis protein ThiI